MAFFHPVMAANLKVPQSYPSIQAAIDKALYGDRVVVSPGTYHERLTLRSGVSVEGNGSAEQPVRLEGTGAGSVVTAAGVTDLTFAGLRTPPPSSGATSCGTARRRVSWPPATPTRRSCRTPSRATCGASS
jgi:pectin methylesterase-like acyl-CoA thioesterase